jgi:isocitrate/isopropylmalate dehydrogenase
VLNTSYPAAQVTHALMDELAKKLVGQPSRFG